MRAACLFLVIALAAGRPAIRAEQLASPTNARPQYIFPGSNKNIPVILSNPGPRPFDCEIHVEILQASSATVAPAGSSKSKRIQLLPGQTVLESMPLDFPNVTAETRFLVEWMDNSNHIIARTEVLVYPTNLLNELSPLLKGEVLGVLDPERALMPALQQNHVDFVSLEDTALGNFSGRLAIIGPAPTRARAHSSLPGAIRRIAQKGTAVVWIQPPSGPENDTAPSYYIVSEGHGAVVVVQPELLEDFSRNPKAQLSLVHFCKLALNPEPPALPDLSRQP